MEKRPPLTPPRVLHLATEPPETPMNDDVLSARRGYSAGTISCAIAQTKPASSRAIAVTIRSEHRHVGLQSTTRDDVFFASVQSALLRRTYRWTS
jgi:hypothetical protein